MVGFARGMGTLRAPDCLACRAGGFPLQELGVWTRAHPIRRGRWRGHGHRRGEGLRPRLPLAAGHGWARGPRPGSRWLRRRETARPAAAGTRTGRRRARARARRAGRRRAHAQTGPRARGHRAGGAGRGAERISALADK